MTEEKIANEFMEEYGVSLYEVLSDEDYPSNKIKRFFNNCSDLIVAYIGTFNPTAVLTEEQIKEFVYEEMDYIIRNYDYSKIAFVDIFNNTVGDLNALLERYLKPILKIKIKNSGLCYRGLQ